MIGKGRTILVVLAMALLMMALRTSNVMCRDMDDCQPPGRETWVMHRGDRLDLQAWCHHEKPGDIEPEPPIGTVIRLRVGQRIKVRARLWGQGVRIQCGTPCRDWGNECRWDGGDIPKGSVFTVICKK